MPTELALTSGASLPAPYINTLQQYPLLSAESEYHYAVAYHQNNDIQAAHILVVSNLRGVLHVARQYLGYGLPYMDLVQEGSIGLMRAVKRFNPYQKVRLFAYALPWIKAEIQKYVINNWKIVKAATTDAKKKLFFNMRSLKSRLMPLGGDTNEKIAQELGVPLKDVLAMDAHLYTPDDALETTNGDEGAVMLSLPAPDELQPELQLLQLEGEHMAVEGVAAALATLDERSSKIVQARYLQEPPITLQALSKEYGVSIERVRQIETNALKKLKKALPYFEDGTVA